jgi:hypothetical protein
MFNWEPHQIAAFEGLQAASTPEAIAKFFETFLAAPSPKKRCPSMAALLQMHQANTMERP